MMEQHQRWLEDRASLFFKGKLYKVSHAVDGRMYIATTDGSVHEMNSGGHLVCHPECQDLERRVLACQYT